MKRLAVLFVVFWATLSGCTVGPQVRRPAGLPKPPSEMVFSANFEKVWDAVIKAIPDYPIINKNKDSGRIVTGWKIIKGSKRERLNILVKKEGNGTRAAVESHMEVLDKSARVETGFGTTTRMAQWNPAPSDTITAGEIFTKIDEALSKKPPPPEKGKEEKDAQKP